MGLDGINDVEAKYHRLRAEAILNDSNVKTDNGIDGIDGFAHGGTQDAIHVTRGDTELPDIDSPAHIKQDVNVGLPMSCDPPGPNNPVTRLVWIVSVVSRFSCHVSISRPTQCIVHNTSNSYRCCQDIFITNTSSDLRSNRSHWPLPRPLRPAPRRPRSRRRPNRHQHPLLHLKLAPQLPRDIMRCPRSFHRRRSLRKSPCPLRPLRYSDEL